MYGQYCIVIPAQNCVIAVTSNVDMGKFMKLIWSDLLPWLSGGTALPGSTDYTSLVEFGTKQTHLKVNGNAEPYPTFRATYKLSPSAKVPDDFKVNKISFDFENGECLLAIYNNESDQPFSVACFKEKQWVETAKPFWESRAFYRAVCYGEWNHEQFLACIWHYETPVNTKFRITFSEERRSLTLQLDTLKDLSLNFDRITAGR